MRDRLSTVARCGGERPHELWRTHDSRRAPGSVRSRLHVRVPSPAAHRRLAKLDRLPGSSDWPAFDSPHREHESDNHPIMTGEPTPPDAETYLAATSGLPLGKRFTPGTLVDGRFRIVAPLGRGGMGEVYRADDTKLGHAVALKFLPRRGVADATNLDRLRAEVRLGRQVSHPNVCRIYDIGESPEGSFIAMEYVDGEDLASLLRRIGRLPADKALEIARDLSAGLAAAHDLGILHRDLKPANVMIDGRGRARITDFGLAALAAELERGRIWRPSSSRAGR